MLACSSGVPPRLTAANVFRRVERSTGVDDRLTVVQLAPFLILLAQRRIEGIAPALTQDVDVLCGRAERVLSAQMTSALFDGSISSSTTDRVARHQPAGLTVRRDPRRLGGMAGAISATGLVTIHMRLPPISDTHTLLIAGMPARRSASLT